MTEKEASISQAQKLADFEDGVTRRRWMVRRRFAIICFAEMITMPIWAGYVIKNMHVPSELLFSILWALITIIGVYIGGVVIDDNWKKR